MRTKTSLLVGIIIVCGLLTVGCVKTYKVTQPLMEPVQPQTTIHVGEITDNLPVDMEADDKPTLQHIQMFQSKLREELGSRKNLNLVAVDEGANLEVTGSILEYKKGSGWLRFFIGFGAGNAVVNTELRLVDTNSGKLLFSGNFKQKVSGWGESGDATWKRIAKDFSKALEKQNKKLLKESNT